MTKRQIIATAHDHKNVVSDLSERLASKTENAPILTSRGAISICALRRGNRYIGYAVWSCREQGFVAGSWSQPLDWDAAVSAESSMPWAG